MEVQCREKPEFITYEMFGAMGDGVHDDMPAIVRAHEEANRQGLPVRARAGAAYYISPRDRTAIVQTSVDWTGARFIIDDVNCERYTSPVFHVASALQPLPLEAENMVCGQTKLDNPFGCDLHVIVRNEKHMDYIRKGLNQDNGHARTDVFVLNADGTLSSPLSFDFEEITSLRAFPIDRELLTIRGGEFTTIANQAESKYNYHLRNIHITRSHVEVSQITHLITGETDHGAPYRGFITLYDCARISLHDCTFTGHYIYSTIGSAGLPVPMGSYDLSLGQAADIRIARCRQTNDILDKRYWGLIGTNFCRDLCFEDCHFSRFDAHMGVGNCTLRGCRLGWQCLNAIGNGSFLIEDTEIQGYAFVNLREDYGCTWRGDMIIRNCTWVPLSSRRSVISGNNDGTHDFGYVCHMPNVTIDGLKIVENDATDGMPLYIFNNYLGADTPATPQRPFTPVPPSRVEVRNIATSRPIALCEAPSLMPETAYSAT